MQINLCIQIITPKYLWNTLCSFVRYYYGRAKLFRFETHMNIRTSYFEMKRFPSLYRIFVCTPITEQLDYVSKSNQKHSAMLIYGLHPIINNNIGVVDFDSIRPLKREEKKRYMFRTANGGWKILILRSVTHFNIRRTSLIFALDTMPVKMTWIIGFRP